MIVPYIRFADNLYIKLTTQNSTNNTREIDMVKVKSEQAIKSNYEASTTDVGRRFEQGVQGADWRESALAGQDLYVEQMSKSEILARRSRGIEKVSDAEWRTATVSKGRNIIGDRMKKASQKQIDGYRPYRTLLEGISLPPKTADPVQNTMNRVIPIVEAQANLKKELKGG